MTFFSLARFIASTFSSRGVSMNGPFFSDLLISFFAAGSWRLAAGSGPRRSAAGCPLTAAAAYFVRLCTMNWSVDFWLRVL